MSAWCALVFLIVPFALTAQLPSYLPTNGLVAWYPFNGNANDESGNGTNGIVNGATLAPNRFGQSNSAYSFDGINDFIQYPQGSNTPINIVGDISFGYWIKTTAAEGIITSFGDQLAGQGGYLSGLRDGPAEPSPGQLGYWVGGTWITSSALINDDNWTFIMVTYTGGQLKLYVNGNLDSQHSGMPAASWNGNRTLGKPNYVDARFFSGLLDDFVIYSRALSATEINSLYTANSANNTSNTVNPAPPGIPYQAEVRNENGEVLANTNVNIRFTLHEQAANGTVSYQETHALTTNDIGLFAATIGAGTAVQGTFASINWAQTTKFLQVEVDTGSGWITMGNQQLMSVPYALYAANGPSGPVGPQGPAGADGQPGPQGEPGANGLSAYELWLAEGYSGSVSDFLNSQTNNSSTAHGSFQATGLGVFVVPNNVKNIELNMSGSIGGNGGTAIGLGFTQYTGGAGGISGFIRVIIPVNPGDSIMFQIGNNGINGDNCLATGSCGSFPGCACVGGSGTPGEISTLKLNGMNLFHISGGTGGTGGSYGLPNAFGNSGSQGIVTFSSQSISSGIIPLATNVWNIEQRSILIRY